MHLLLRRCSTRHRQCPGAAICLLLGYTIAACCAHSRWCRAWGPRRASSRAGPAPPPPPPHAPPGRPGGARGLHVRGRRRTSGQGGRRGCERAGWRVVPGLPVASCYPVCRRIMPSVRSQGSPGAGRGAQGSKPPPPDGWRHSRLASCGRAAALNAHREAMAARWTDNGERASTGADGLRVIVEGFGTWGRPA